MSRQRLRMILLVGAAGARARRRRRVLSFRRPLHLHRQRLCRRAEGADHAGHFRQDRARRRARGPARQSRRRAVHARSGALPPRARHGASQTRRRPRRLRQAQDQPRLARQRWRHWRRRTSSSSSATSIARPTLVRIASRLAGRRRYRNRRPGDRATASPVHRRSSATRRSTSCSTIPTCRWRNSPNTPRPRRRSTVPSAIRPHDRARADFRHRHAGRQHPARPLRRRRHAGVQHRSTTRRLGRRQSEGNRHHLSARRAEGDARRRQFPRPHLQGHRDRGLARHRRAVLHPAAAERQRQLGQGGAARAGAHRLRQGRGHASVALRHERRRRHRHRA